MSKPSRKSHLPCADLTGKTLLIGKKTDIDYMKILNQQFSIQETSQKCGVPKSTLRFWEKKFGDLLSPNRSKGGQRRYSAEQVSVIILINHMKAQGLSLDEIGERISSGTTADRLPSNPSIERLGDQIAALVKFEVRRFLDGELQAEPARQNSSRVNSKRRG